MQNYESPILLELDKPVTFPDFVIEYIGDRTKRLPEFDRDFIYKDYKITNGRNENIISWSAGTGLLFPLKFSVDGKSFSFQPWGIDFKHKEISIKQL